MKKNIKLIYLVELALFFFTLIICGLINVIASKYRIFIAITFLLVLLIASYLIFGLKKDNNYNKNSSIRIVVAKLMFFGIIAYLLGIILGFNRGFAYSMQSLMYGVIPTIALVVITELLRFILLKNTFGHKKTIIIFTVLIIIFNVATKVGVIDSNYKLFLFFVATVLPTIAIESLCSYLVMKVGPVSGIVLKLTLGLYPYIFPIVPNLGDYIKTVIDIILVYSTYTTINKGLLEYEKNDKYIDKFNIRIFTYPIIIVLIGLVILVSGIFKYQLIAIASDSMNPVFSRGDALFIEKCDIDTIEVGDILVFKNSNAIITHRVIKKEVVNNDIKLTTKGDNNKAKDDIISTSSNVIGKAHFAIKYIGLPTVWINEIFNRL